MLNERFLFLLSFLVARGLYTRQLGQTRVRNAPVEHTEELHDAFLASRGTRRRDLDREPVQAAVVADDGEATEEDAVRARDVELVRKVTDSNVVGVVVLVLRILDQYCRLDQKAERTLRYWPGTSISSNFWYWNSTSQ